MAKGDNPKPGPRKSNAGTTSDAAQQSQQPASEPDDQAEPDDKAAADVDDTDTGPEPPLSPQPEPQPEPRKEISEQPTEPKTGDVHKMFRFERRSGRRRR